MQLKARASCEVVFKFVLLVVVRPGSRHVLLQLRLPLPSLKVDMVCRGSVFIQPPVDKQTAVDQSISIHECRIQVVKIKLIIETLPFVSVLCFHRSTNFLSC